MDVYEKDSDHFSKEYLDYLGTLTSEVVVISGIERARYTRNPAGKLVRVERWVGVLGTKEAWAYQDRHLPGWMEP